MRCSGRETNVLESGRVCPRKCLALSFEDWTIMSNVAHHADVYIIMKHWYCDVPEMITRKDFYLYSDAACTKLVKSWSVEALVGVTK